jgi:hypothetical protein
MTGASGYNLASDIHIIDLVIELDIVATVI